MPSKPYSNHGSCIRLLGRSGVEQRPCQLELLPFHIEHHPWLPRPASCRDRGSDPRSGEIRHESLPPSALTLCKAGHIAPVHLQQHSTLRLLRIWQEHEDLIFGSCCLSIASTTEPEHLPCLRDLPATQSQPTTARALTGSDGQPQIRSPIFWRGVRHHMYPGRPREFEQF